MGAGAVLSSAGQQREHHQEPGQLTSSTVSRSAPPPRGAGSRQLSPPLPPSPGLAAVAAATGCVTGREPAAEPWTAALVRVLTGCEPPVEPARGVAVRWSVCVTGVPAEPGCAARSPVPADGRVRGARPGGDRGRSRHRQSRHRRRGARCARDDGAAGRRWVRPAVARCRAGSSAAPWGRAASGERCGSVRLDHLGANLDAGLRAATVAAVRAGRSANAASPARRGPPARGDASVCPAHAQASSRGGRSDCAGCRVSG